MDGKEEKKRDQAEEAHKGRSLYLPLDEFKALLVAQNWIRNLAPLRKQT